MDMNYYIKIQNAYGTKSKREKSLATASRTLSGHFEDTYATEKVLLNHSVTKLMITKDTGSNPLKKAIKSLHTDRIRPGDYVCWNNGNWMVTETDPDHKAGNSGSMCLCTILLRWQNERGEIIERWGLPQETLNDSRGTAGNDVIMTADNRYDITLPIDPETKKLKRDMRFAIDFEDSGEPDVYKLTNRKINTNDGTCFDRGGTMAITLSFDAFNRDKDKKILLEDGHEAWICGYQAAAPPTAPLTGQTIIFISGSPTLKRGSIKTYTAHFTDERGENVTPPPYLWHVVSDFDVIQIREGEHIQLQTADKNSIDKTLELQLIVGTSVAAKLEITTVDCF